MKLSAIPGVEPTVKHGFSFRQSTADMLQFYHQCYSRHIGSDVALKDVVERMLLDFMEDDKAFQREWRLHQQALSKPGKEPALVVGEPAGVAQPPVDLLARG